MPGDMWMIQAMIQPFRLETVTLALARVPGFGGMTVSDCRGFGQGRLGGDDEAVGGVSDPARKHAEAGLVDFTPKVKLEIAVVGRELADAIAETISRTAHTGRKGDGKIFVWSIVRAVRVRTFEEDERAL